MSGMPGSGKSHYAKTLSQNNLPSIVVSADHYFEDKPGGYKKNFNRNDLSKAHGGCLRLFLVSLENGENLGINYLIVDNTNLSAWEAAPYVCLAAAYGYECEIVRVNTPYETCLKRQTHNVPTKVMKSMKWRWDKPNFPPFWKVVNIDG